MRRRWIATLGLLTAACGGTTTPPTPPTPAAPQITCPADVTVKGITGSSQAVTYAAPTVTAGTPPVNVSCSQVSGASFPLGSSTVSCTATDAQSRQAACSFEVTVSGIVLSVTKFDAVGDSFTEGENGRRPSFLDPPNAYPTKLQAAFDATYPGQGLIVINRGISGELVEKTVLDLPGNLTKDRPGAVLVLSGFNNLINGCGHGPATTVACQNSIGDVGIGIRDCIRRAKEAPFNIAYVFVSTLTPPGPVLPGATDDRRISSDAILQANARIRQQVAAERATLVDAYPLFIGHEAEYVDTDGLHLRPAGYQVLADAFFAAIKSTIPQTTPLASVNGLR